MNKENIEFYSTQPESINSRLLKLVFQLTRLKKIMEHFSWSRIFIHLSSTPYPIHLLKRIAEVKQHVVNKKTVFTLSPRSHASETVVLYLHGGGFTVNFTRPHWHFIKDLIQQTHCTVVAPDFPLLPDYDYKARLNMVYNVYQELNKKTESKNIVIMGDSSGGNMALALAQTLYEQQANVPAQVILLSPWLDVSMDNPELKTNLPSDPMLSFKAAVRAGKAHAGDDPTTFYQVSPLYGRLKDIGTISLFTGTSDILHPDARKLKSLARAQGVDFNYFEYASMIHAWMLFDMPETQLARKQIASLVAHPSNNIS